jgi:hypothetical protein
VPVGLLSWLLGKQVALGQRRSDAALSQLSLAELEELLDRTQFDGVLHLRPELAPRVEELLARVERRDYAALARDLEARALDLNGVFYAPSVVDRPFDYDRHFAAICRELSERKGPR